MGGVRHGVIDGPGAIDSQNETRNAGRTTRTRATDGHRHAGRSSKQHSLHDGGENEVHEHVNGVLQSHLNTATSLLVADGQFAAFRSLVKSSSLTHGSVSRAALTHPSDRTDNRTAKDFIDMMKLRTTRVKQYRSYCVLKR